MKKVLFLLSNMLLTLSVWAQTFTVDGISYNVVSSTNNTVEVVAKSPVYSGSVVIPATVTSDTVTYNVTAIGALAFSGCSGLTAVTIPKTVDTIKASAFNNCSHLARVDYTGTINEWCGITFVDLAANPLFYSHCLYIGNNKVTNIEGLDGITEIKKYTFAGCNGLTSVTLPSSLTTIGNGAFQDCEYLTSVDLGGAVATISSDAFLRCNNLSSVVVPITVTTIGSSAFNYCNSLSDVWLLPAKAPTLGSYAFSNCNSSIKLYVPFGSNYSSGGWSSYSSKITEGVLCDGTAYSSAASTSGKIRYTRTFSSRTWVPLFVPFSSLVSEWTDLGFTIAELDNVSYDADSQCDVMTWNTVTSGTLQANHPYIIRYNGAEPCTFDHVFADCAIAASTLNNSNSVACSNVVASDDNARLYTLTGTYDTIRYGGTGAPGQWYAMGGGNFWAATTGNVLLPQRFYLTITDPTTGAYKSAPQGGTILRVGSDNVGIIRPDASVQPFEDDNYYDLLGRRVDQPLKGHLYIHNHKKIIY